MTLSARHRGLLLAVIVALAVVSGVGYVALQRSQQQSVSAAGLTRGSLTVADVRAGPHIAFRSTTLGQTYGKVALVPLSRPGEARAVTAAECERVYAAARRTLCLAAERGLVTSYNASVLDERLRPVRKLPLSGIASRARLSRDGSLAATTTFVSGHSYASSSFSTQTLVSTVDGSSTVNLEDFRLSHQGKVIRPVDRNIWGVTFADNDAFYATVAWDGRTWLSRGSLESRQLTTMRMDAECPSLSPDGTRVAYKKRLGQAPGRWRLASLDLRTGRESVLAEQTSVDDQVEWLDNSTVIYGLPRTGAEAAISDVWGARADGTGTPQRLIAEAWSPAVVR